MSTYDDISDYITSATLPDPVEKPKSPQFFGGLRHLVEVAPTDKARENALTEYLLCENITERIISTAKSLYAFTPNTTLAILKPRYNIPGDVIIPDRTCTVQLVGRSDLSSDTFVIMEETGLLNQTKSDVLATMARKLEALWGSRCAKARGRDDWLAGRQECYRVKGLRKSRRLRHEGGIQGRDAETARGVVSENGEGSEKEEENVEAMGGEDAGGPIVTEVVDGDIDNAEHDDKDNDTKEKNEKQDDEKEDKKEKEQPWDGHDGSCGI